jgi:NADPH:quinone reductase-like Zn-dependent oxidoreductase
MYAIQLQQPKLDSFRRVELEAPTLGRGELRVRMRAASLNFVDYAIASGAYKAPRFPLVPVADGAGEVLEVGPEVQGFALGDRVVAHAKPAWIGGPPDPLSSMIMRGYDRPGSLAEEVVLPASALVHIPAQLDFEQAATLPIAATTAWNAIRAADVRAGSRVLLLGTGGVSIFALQLAKAVGAHVTITSSSAAKLERARQLGADATIDYRREPDWERVYLDQHEQRGADLVLDTVGQQTLARSLTAVGWGGTVFTVGFLSGTQSSLDMMQLIVKAARMQGNNTGSVADLRAAVRAVAAARIAPVIDRVFGLEETRAAYEQLAGAHFGKLVITHASA